MKWDKEALDEISRVPFFVRSRVKKRVEEEAARQKARVVRLRHVEAAKKRFLKTIDQQVKGFRVETCFGNSGCPNRAADTKELLARIEEILASRNLREFLEKKVAGPLKLLHEFRVTVSDCPNGCSRPQIVDIGIIGAKEPGVSPEECTACGECVEVCGEDAVKLVGEEGPPEIDPEKCLYCGQCIEVCPTGTIEAAREGFRILVGGKLGRHPQLGMELEGIHSLDDALRIVERCLDLYLAQNQKGERFGEIVNRIGPEELARLIKEER